MTSGHGGQDPQQGWQPPQQGWQAPPPQQGWQAPPPPGPYGYGPAPSGPGWEPPPAPERPTTVKVGVGAFLATLILGVISSLVQFSDIDGLVARTVAISNDPALTADVVRAGLVLGAVIGLLLVGLEALFIWFAWQGRNWARVVLWVIAGLGVLGGLLTQFSSTYEPGFLRTLSLFQWLLVLAAIVLLAARRSNEWYRYRRWLRDNGRPA
jgi:hypothetical protein